MIVKQPWIRRLIFSWTLQLSGLAFGAEITVLVTPIEGGFQIKAEFAAPVSKNVAYEVLTDFDNMQKFLPNLVESRVVDRRDDQLVVKQAGTAKVGWMSVPYESNRKVVLSPKTYTVRSVSEDNGKMQSTSQVVGEDGNVKVQYAAEWFPSSSMVRGFGASSAQKQAETQFASLVKEMIARK